MSIVIPHAFANAGLNTPGQYLDDDFNVLRDYTNARNPTVGPVGSRPAAGNAGAIWVASDQAYQAYIDNGSTWIALGPAAPRAYLAGLQLSNDAGDTNHDIAIAVGSCRDSTNTQDMVLASPLVKQIDAAWAAGTAAGGMFTGSAVVDTFYHVFLIRKDSDGTLDAGFDTSVTAANRPAGYSTYRRLGSVYEQNPSLTLAQFTQSGDLFWWNTGPWQDVLGVTNPGTSAINYKMRVPPGVITSVLITASFKATTAADTMFIYPPSSNDVASQATNHYGIAAPTTGVFYTGNVECMTDINGNVRVRVLGSSSGACVTNVNTLGYRDRRGRDD